MGRARGGSSTKEEDLLASSFGVQAATKKDKNPECNYQGQRRPGLAAVERTEKSSFIRSSPSRRKLLPNFHRGEADVPGRMLSPTKWDSFMFTYSICVAEETKGRSNRKKKKNQRKGKRARGKAIKGERE